jgi:dihydroorotate dehydrogenase
MKGLILRGVDFGPVFTSSGTRNFFGEGYRQHKLYRFIPGWDIKRPTMITKTFTRYRRMPKETEKGGDQGNMVIDEVTWQPVDLLPDCIKVNFLTGDALNAVGLVNPGIEAGLATNRLQMINKPFVLSFMPLGKDREARLLETREFAAILKEELPYFLAPVALEVNESCPNTKHDPAVFTAEAVDHLKETSILGIPQGIKINVLTSVEMVERVVDSGLCDFLDLPNTISFGQRPDKISWEYKFGSTTSPLAKYGGGGCSCEENFELAARLVDDIRSAGVVLPIILGGVFSKDDVRLAKTVGADAVAYARASMVRPWRLKGINNEAYRLFGR